ncbi:hypothetical protein GCM10010518_08910 [Kitasatospora cinereorecta]
MVPITASARKGMTVSWVPSTTAVDMVMRMAIPPTGSTGGPDPPRAEHLRLEATPEKQSRESIVKQLDAFDEWCRL